MAANDLVRVEFGATEKPKDQIIYKDLNSLAANIIGTSYKGPAFVPKILFNQDTLNAIEVKNNLTSIFGNHRQNRYEHLYDGYACYANSDAYDAASFWLQNGGEYTYFTRVLGIGSGIKNKSTGKMIGSGFNLSKNISSGTLDHKRSDYLNANHTVNNATPGRIGFVIKRITELGKLPNHWSGEDVNSNPIDEIDYFHELGIISDTLGPYAGMTKHILTDVLMFASDVLPDLTSAILAGPAKFVYDSSVLISTLDNISNYQIRKPDHYLTFKNFNPHELSLDESVDQTQEKLHKQIDLNRGESIPLKRSISYLSQDANQFPERFYKKGHLRYASYPICGFSNPGVNTTSGILLSKDYQDFEASERESIPDYNSFECHYQTAKTPWITAQPINRSDFGNIGIDDNRALIHSEVQNLFRFWSLDDGEVGNRFRIKINIKKRGDDNTANTNTDDQYASFDVYISEYDPRTNEFTKLQEFRDLNLNPDSSMYIGREIGTKNTYYDFDADKLITKGKYENKSKFIRVEIHEDIIEDNSNNMYIPSGFRSYPHINLEKDAFNHYKVNDSNVANVDLDDIFDVTPIYHLPPLYALNYYEDDLYEGINNNWGIVFTPPKIDKTVQEFSLKRNSSDIEQRKLSPHYFYTKYFLSGIENIDDQEVKNNVWIEEDNYLNSFFHLEKIAFKNNNDGRTNFNSNFDLNNVKNMQYKHSGSKITIGDDPVNGYEYLDLSNSSDIWKDNRELKSAFNNKLSFDFFTYGGFDGVDIRDSDKRFLRNDAIIRELNNEDETSNIDGATYNSYVRAIDIATDEANASSDILIVPGIKEIPIIRKCVDICENSRSKFFIADVSGACSNTLINFTNQTKITNQAEIDDDPTIKHIYADTLIKTSLGVMGQQFILSNNLSGNYNLDKSLLRDTDSRFLLTDTNIPIEGEVKEYYTFESVIEKQFDNIISLWPTYYITSKYFMPVFGDLVAHEYVLDANDDQQTVLSKKVCPEAFVLGLIANSGLREVLTDKNTAPTFIDHPNVTMSLLNSGLTQAHEDFDNNAKKLKEAGINAIFRPSQPDSTIKLLSQNTAYEVRGSIFKDQGVVRTIQQIRKRIMFDIFLNQDLAIGGFFFTQNSNLENLYAKLEIQLNTLLSTFVEENLISDYILRIPKEQDDKTLLDMQNYILRGSIILQMNLSDTIDIELDNILSELSLLTDPTADVVLVPRI